MSTDHGMSTDRGMSTDHGMSIGSRSSTDRGWRRALAADLRLNLTTVGGMIALAVLAILLSAFAASLTAFFCLVWAVLAWYRYGRTGSAQRDLLLAGMGLSRADRVRGRVALVGIESAMLWAAWLICTVVGLRTAGPDDLSPDLVEHPVLTTISGALAVILILLIVALLVGRECVVRRPGWGMFGLSLLSGMGAAIIAGIISAASIAALTGSWNVLLAVRPSTAWISATALVVLILLTALLLRSRVRAWIRALDAGGETADG